MWTTEAAQIQAQTFVRHSAFTVLWTGALPDEQPLLTGGCWSLDVPKMLTQSRFSKLNTKIKNLKYCVSFSY